MYVHVHDILTRSINLLNSKSHSYMLKKDIFMNNGFFFKLPIASVFVTQCLDFSTCNL